MLDVFTTAQTLVDHTLARYAADIDIIGYYGSYAQGRATEHSDLDIFYVPADGKDPPAGRTFLLEGRLFDFWAIRWQTLAGFADGALRGWAVAPALVYYTHILYARSADQAARFEQLRQHIDHLRQPQARPAMIRRALAAFPGAINQLALLHRAAQANDPVSVRYAAWDVATAVYECLALANQTFLDRGFAGINDHIPSLADRPDNLAESLDILATDSNPARLLATAERLVAETRDLLYRLQLPLPPRSTIPAAFAGAYPEIKAAIDKVLAACQRGDRFAAAIAARSVQFEITWMLASTQSGVEQSGFHCYHEVAARYRELGLVDLVYEATGQLDDLAAQTIALDRQLRDWLRSESVDLCEFQTLADLRSWLA